MSGNTCRLYPREYASRNPDKPAVIMAESGASMSYRELDGYANRLGRLYQWLGLKTGDHVAYCLGNRLECPAVQWGAHYVGLYYTFVSTRLAAQEVGYIISDCEARVVVVSANTPSAIIDELRALPTAPRIYSLIGFLGSVT